jgi:hypothetical protein
MSDDGRKASLCGDVATSYRFRSYRRPLGLSATELIRGLLWLAELSILAYASVRACNVNSQEFRSLLKRGPVTPLFIGGYI